MMLQTSRRIYNTLRKSSPILLQSKHASSGQTSLSDKYNMTWLVAGSLAATGGSYLYSTNCEEHITVASAPAMPEEDEEFDAGLPIYTSAQVAIHDGKKTSKVWMSYGGYVYDVTEFVANHPGGQQKILLAAGGAIEPYWHCKFDMYFLCALSVLYLLMEYWFILCHNPS